MTKKIQKINISEKLSIFNEFWSPKKIGELNDCNVQLAKCEGELPWHHHDDEDEMFLTISGEFIVRTREEEFCLKKGECLFMPRGIEHQTAAKKQTEIIYISKKGTVNTGNVKEERTVTNPEKI